MFFEFLYCITHTSQKATFFIFTSVRISYLAEVSVIITTTTTTNTATAFLNICVVKGLILQNFLVYNISCTDNAWANK